MFLLIPRLLILITLSIILAVALKILMVCHDLDKPLGPIRKFLCQWFTKLIALLIGVFGLFMFMGYSYMTPE